MGLKPGIKRIWLTAISAGLMGGGAFCEDFILSSRLMYVPFENSTGNYRERAFRILDQKGMEKGRGTAASDKAFEVAEWPLYGHGEDEPSGNYTYARWFPTGGEGQSVAFPSGGNWQDGSGSLIFWVKGKGWDISVPQAEELITLEGEKGNVVFGKTAAKTLSVYAPGTAQVDIPIDFDPDRLHQFALTYADCKATIYVDGQPKAENILLPMPGKIKRIIVGQATAGGRTNKVIDDLSTYDRPLLPAEINRLVVEQGLVVGRKLMAVTKARKPIQVDGILSPEEWGQAAEVTGLLKIAYASIYDFSGPADLAMDQSRFWVTYDDQYLYFAHHSPPPAKIADQVQLIVAMLASAVTKHDDSVERDDSLRFSIVNPYPNGDEYKVFVNHLGTTYDFYDGGSAPGSQLKGISIAWEPKLKLRDTLTDKGWSVELAIPWSDFYFGEPKAGETLHINMARIWKQVIQEDHAWCFGNRDWKDCTRLGRPAGEVVFQGEQGVVVQLKDVGQIRRGSMDFEAVLINLTDKPKTLSVKVATNSGELDGEEQVALAPGESKPYSRKGRIVDFRTHEVVFTVADAADGRLYHVTTLPVLRKYRPEIRLRKYRSREEIKLQCNAEFMGACDLKDIHLGIAIRDEKTKKTVFEKSYSGLPSYTPEFTVSTRDWPVGTYAAELTFSAKDAKPITHSTAYERPPLPEWWENEIGRELGVPYPWTAMKLADNDGISCWNRIYQFGRRLLPEQIITWCTPQGKMLRSPMRLAVKSAAGETLDSSTADADTKWTKQTDLRIEGVRSIAGKDFSIQNELWSEYDGLVWCRLTIQPKNKVIIDSMELEIPLTKEFTDVINTYDYSQRQTGRLPERGFVCENRPVWLGNGDGGIQWFCETDGWFFQKDSRKMMNIELHPEGVTMRVVMIDVPTEFEKPHVIEFGFTATPVRPKLYRTWSDPRSWGVIGGPGPWYPQGDEYLPAPDYWGGKKSGWRGIVQEPPIRMWMQNIYITTGAINTKTKDFEDFGDEWLASDNTLPADVVGTTHASKSYRDWFVWRHWKSFQGNPHQSLYYDGAMESPSANPYAGAGYVRRDGSVAVTYPILGARDICKRLYNMIIQYYPFIWVGMHQSGMPNMAYEGFGTFSWDGENFNSIMNDRQQTYVGVLDPAKFRAEYMGHNFGWPVMFLGQGRIRAEWADAAGCENLIDHLHGLCLLHDVEAGGWQIQGEREKVCERTYRAVERNRLYSPAYQFIPYWRQDIVQLPKPEMYASFYILQPWKIDKSRDWSFYAGKEDAPVPKKAVMIVYNNSDYKGEMRLKPDWKKLGFDSPGNVTAENSVHSTGFRIEKAKNEKGEEVDKAVFFPRPEESAKIENGEAVFPMTPFNYRMIVLEEAK